jgi:hypothetical protein
MYLDCGKVKKIIRRRREGEDEERSLLTPKTK